MTCTKIGSMIICNFSGETWRIRTDDGGYVFLEWHSYMGPMFFEDRLCTKEIRDWFENPHLVSAYEWFMDRGKRA